MVRRNVLRPAGFDELGLRRARADRMLPFLVASMAFLAALALAGWVGAATLADHWQAGAGTAVTVQVPDPSEHAGDGETTRLDRAIAFLQASPAVASVRALSAEELDALLRPWLGGSSGDQTMPLSVPLPGVVAVNLVQANMKIAPLARRLEQVVPGALVETHDLWVGRITILARSLQVCAGAVLLIVVAVASAVIAVATRAGLAARREEIEIVHGLGASDGYIAGRFAGRATALATAGGLVGGLTSLPVLLVLAELASPLVGANPPGPLSALPWAVWMLLPGLPLTAAAIGFATAQGTVRRWLRRLP
jgi:cell division transport system permease protein